MLTLGANAIFFGGNKEKLPLPEAIVYKWTFLQISDVRINQCRTEMK